MTYKQKVQQVYPWAYLSKAKTNLSGMQFYFSVIWSSYEKKKLLGEGTNAASAWQDAWRRVKEAKK